MFVYQSPGYRHHFFSPEQYGNYQKWPTHDWYWIHRRLDDPSPPTGYPQYFQGGHIYGYGHFVLSVMLKFKLANVYVTNLVKCGLHEQSGSPMPFGAFRHECVQNCYHRYLQEEFRI